MTHKQAILKIFLNTATGTYYIQMNDAMYPIKEQVALLISDKEGLEIRKADGVKAMQELSLSDNNKPDSL